MRVVSLKSDRWLAANRWHLAKQRRKAGPAAQHGVGFGRIAFTIAIMGGTCMDDEGGEKAKGRPAEFAGLHDDAGAGAASARGKGQDGGMGGKCEHIGQQISADDKREVATGGKAAQTGRDPCGDGCGDLQGSGAACIG